MTVRHRSRGEGRERSFMRTCGAEKLPWLVVEVEVDAERAGCFAERQVRLGLVVDEAIPETRDWLGSPVRRTRTSGRMRVGPWYGALCGARHGQGGIQFHQHAPEHGEPASAADGRFCYPNHPLEGRRLVCAFLRTELALPEAHTTSTGGASLPLRSHAKLRCRSFRRSKFRAHH